MSTSRKANYLRPATTKWPDTRLVRGILVQISIYAELKTDTVNTMASRLWLLLVLKYMKRQQTPEL